MHIPPNIHSDRTRRRLRVGGAVLAVVGLFVYVLAPIVIIGYMGDLGVRPLSKTTEWSLVAITSLAGFAVIAGLLMLYVGYRKRLVEVTAPCASCGRWLPGDARYCSGCGAAV